MTSLGSERRLHFLVTGEMPCPYLPGRKERKLITELPLHRAQPTFELLSEAGFRRTHLMAYRPACRGCDACIPVRVRVQDFVPTRTQRKIILRNKDLLSHWNDPVATSEHYALFTQYLLGRHQDSDMVDMREADFVAMIEETSISTKLFESRDAKGELLAACLVDCGSDGFSAVYSFFSPNEGRRSLGSFLILSLLAEAQRANLPYLYLGYWVAGARKMAYKSAYKPLEALTPGGWFDLPSP